MAFLFSTIFGQSIMAAKIYSCESMYGTISYRFFKNPYNGEESHTFTIEKDKASNSVIPQVSIGWHPAYKFNLVTAYMDVIPQRIFHFMVPKFALTSTPMSFEGHIYTATLVDEIFYTETLQLKNCFAKEE
jgi:hypothetical protein